MKILIIYYSQSGNTKKIALSIFDALKDLHHTEIYPVKEASLDELQNYDLIFIGAPCHDATLSKNVLNFMERLPIFEQMPFAGFFTHATMMPEKSERALKLHQEWAGKCLPAFETTAQNKKFRFMGSFHCQGIATAEIEQFIHNTIVTDEAEWQEYQKDLITHPNEKDFQDAREFALAMVKSI